MGTCDVYLKYQKLQDNIKSMGSVAVAFSSGVDSTFLLHAAVDALGSRVLALTAYSCLFPEKELEEADAFCKERNIRHIVVPFNAFDIDGFCRNPKNRCYLCKRELFQKMRAIAKENHISMIVEGSNADDNKDYRPGLLAVKELKIASPLQYAGFTKKEIRQLSKEFGLATWDKPSYACLASRFVYGETINEEKLQMVDKAEQLLHRLGVRQVRVRIHGTLARIEVLPQEFERIVAEDMRTMIYTHLKSLGFTYVTLDFMGYRTGSMNETIPDFPILQSLDKSIL